LTSGLIFGNGQRLFNEESGVEMGEIGIIEKIRLENYLRTLEELSESKEMKKDPAYVMAVTDGIVRITLLLKDLKN